MLFMAASIVLVKYVRSHLQLFLYLLVSRLAQLFNAQKVRAARLCHWLRSHIRWTRSIGPGRTTRRSNDEARPSGLRWGLSMVTEWPSRGPSWPRRRPSGAWSHRPPHHHQRYLHQRKRLPPDIYLNYNVRYLRFWLRNAIPRKCRRCVVICVLLLISFNGPWLRKKSIFTRCWHLDDCYLRLPIVRERSIWLISVLIGYDCGRWCMCCWPRWLASITPPSTQKLIKSMIETR